MAEQIQLNLDEVLAGFAETNAQVTQRAVIAEAGIKARDRVIDELAKQVVDLRHQLEEAQPDPEVDAEVDA
jgi:hypothetical protein